MGGTRESSISCEWVKDNPCPLTCWILVFIEFYDIDFLEPTNERHRHDECHPDDVGLPGEDGQNTDLLALVAGK